METPFCIGETCKFDSVFTKEHLMHHIKHQIPTKVTYQRIVDSPGMLPCRADFIDPNLRARFKDAIGKGSPMLFLPNSVLEKDDWCSASGKFIYKLYLFGIIPDGSKACVIVDDIDVYVDVMVPDGVRQADFRDILTGMLVSNRVSFKRIDDVRLFKLKGFQKYKRVWQRIFFNTLDDRKKAIDAINERNRNLPENSKQTPWETASDDVKRDLTYYFPKVARDYRIKTCDWNRISDYKLDTSSKTQPHVCEYTFRVSISNLKKLTKADRLKYSDPNHILAKGKLLEKNKTLVQMWDIETYRKIQNGEVPTVKDTDWNIFMMCSTYHWFYSTDVLFDVCVVDNRTNARKGIGLVIECGNEVNLLIAHMEVMSRMCPDITGAFNGASFDWPLYRQKLKDYKLLLEFKRKISALPISKSIQYPDTEDKVYKKCFKGEKVKIDPETSAVLDTVLNMPGIIDTDIMVVFQKLYPKAEVTRGSSGLNFYLKLNKLEGKNDMPYKKMFRVYERSQKLLNITGCHCVMTVAGSTADPKCEICVDPWITHEELDNNGNVIDPNKYLSTIHKCCHCEKAEQNAEDMAEVGDYCKIDAYRLQQLCVKRAVINDKRKLSDMSYMSLYDSYYRADGVKVRNLIGSYCNKYGIAFSNKQPENKPKCWYVGGWVFPPKRGLHNRRPITGLDFSSLYPSLMMAYNLSPDMIVYLKEIAEQLAAEGYSIYHIKDIMYKLLGPECKKDCSCHKFEYTEGWVVRHNGVHNKDKDLRIDHFEKSIDIAYTDPDTQIPVKLTFNCGDVRDQNEKTQECNDLVARMRRRGVKVSRKVSFAEIRDDYRPISRDFPDNVNDIDMYPAIPIKNRPLRGERMGLFSFIVKKLFDRRVPLKARYVQLSKIKADMESENVTTKTYTVNGVATTYDYEDVCYEHSVIESTQKALKVLTNTYYGESGNSKSPVFELLVSAGITDAGRRNIKKVAEFIKTRGFKVDYGDSVTGDMPILCRQGDKIQYKAIQNMGTGYTWEPYGTKQEIECDYEVWTERGWTKVKRLIRHKVNKDTYGVSTDSGYVKVTEDHSLLDENADRVRPRDVKIGSRLLHTELPKSTSEAVPDAFAMGMFCAQTCYASSIANEKITRWISCQTDRLDVAQRVVNDLERLNIVCMLQTDDQYDNHILTITDLSSIDYVSRYSDVTGVYIPNRILNADRKSKEEFILGFREGGLCTLNCDLDSGKVTFDHLNAARLYHLLVELDYDVRISSNEFTTTLVLGSAGETVRSIKRVNHPGDYVYDFETENNHFGAGVGRMIVHNTDSLYTECPDEVFVDADARYEHNLRLIETQLRNGEVDADAFGRMRLRVRIDYWTEMVEISMVVMNDIRDDVAELLLLDNGTRFLNMAYEEVGFPTVLCGKKKYYMIPHIERVNFYPRELFVRGIDVVKQGQAELSKLLGEEVMRESLSPENYSELLEIVHEKLKKFYSHEWDVEKFVLNAKYKPAKKNVAVQTFVRRMRQHREDCLKKGDHRLAALYWVPEGGDRFQYVVVKKQQTFTIRGLKEKITKGDKMEHLGVYLDSLKGGDPMEIDLDYYMESFIQGIFARFIACYEQFQPPAEYNWDPADQDDYKKIDKFCIDRACSYISEYCQRLQGVDKSANKNIGRVYRGIYNSADKALREDLYRRYGQVATIVNEIDIHVDASPSNALVGHLIESAKQLSEEPEELYQQIVSAQRKRVSVYRLHAIYSSERDYGVVRHRKMSCEKRIALITDELYRLAPRVVRLISTYEQSVDRLIQELRARKEDEGITPTDVTVVNEFPEESKLDLKRLYILYHNLIAVMKVQNQTIGVAKTIILEKNKLINAPMVPNLIQEIANDSKDPFDVPDYTFP